MNLFIWELIFVLLLNIATFVLAQIVIKAIVYKLPKAPAIFLQYVICATLIFLYWLLLQKSPLFLDEFLLVAFVGGIVAIGTYCQWGAIRISLSKTILCKPLSDVVAVTLAVIFLSEVKSWNIPLVVGIILSFGAVWLFSFKKSKTVEQNSDNTDMKKWLLFVVGMILIFGTATFLMKVFTSTFQIETTNFLFYWYVGAAIGSMLVVLLGKKAEKGFSWPEKKFILLIPLASLAIIGNLCTFYWALGLGAVSEIVPLISIGTTFVPVLIGWFLFREKKGLSKREIIGFLIGGIAVLLIILSHK